MNEEKTIKQFSIKKVLEGYGHHTSIHYVSRDGDKHFIECPECHSTELNVIKIMRCKCCHTSFSLNFEDGFYNQSVITDMGSVSSQEEVKLIALDKDKDYFKHIVHPKFQDVDFKKHFPNSEVLILRRDLQTNGKDAHDHAKYKRYAIIPLD